MDMELCRCNFAVLHSILFAFYIVDLLANYAVVYLEKDDCWIR